ncbi:MAG TPA: chromosome segregation protein SMC [Candidatus Omnitrophota bacterium]|nr:chromosome segregation protein SMC [Candidatus Omnitrophota bacterium]
MHLTRLEIFGFKSFSDKTEILFEKGTTAIVGPNGCGKSNISDAIRWVLGERSPKTLRGGKMEDVIFSGTQFRKPQGFAEVSLTIDNHDRILPIAYDEVVITRRLYRSGESEYLLNKTQCRYKDIQELILDTGIGSNSYSMIEQGKIDYILNAQEEERRFLIEEAAGISKYKVKKDEALRKLERTEDNLLRLQDIVSEVEKNINYAERQAKRAAKYKEQFETLKRLETQKAFLDIRGLDEERSRIEAQLTEIAEDFGKQELEIGKKSEELSALQSELTALEQNKGRTGQKKYEAMLRLSELNSKDQANRERKDLLERENRELEQELIRGEERIRVHQESIHEKEREIATIVREKESWAAMTEQVTAQHEAVLQALREKEARARELRSRIFEIAAQAAEKRNRLMEAEISDQREKTKCQQAEQQKERLGKEKHECLEKLSAGNSQDPELDRAASENERRKEAALRVREEIDSAIKSLNGEILDRKMRMQEVRSRLELVETLNKQGVLGKQVSEQVYAESQREGSPVFGLVQKLSDALKITEGYELAIKACLSDWMHALIVKNSGDTARLLEYAKSAGTRGLLLAALPEDTVSLASEPLLQPEDTGAFLGVAKNFVSLPPEYGFLEQELFGRVLVAGALSAEQLPQWLNLARKTKIVTQDGFVLGPLRRVQYFGDFVTENPSDSEMDPDALRLRLDQLERDVSGLEADLNNRNDAILRLNGELETLNRESVQNRIAAESSARIRESLESQLKRLDEEIIYHEMEMAQAHSESERLAAEKKSLEELLGAVTSNEQTEQRHLEDVLAELAQLGQQREELSLRVNEHAKRLERFTDQHKFLTESVELLSRNVRAESESQEKRKGKISENHLTVARLGDEITNAVQIRQGFETEICAIEQVLAELDSQHAKLSDDKDVLSKYLQELRTLADQRKERQHALELQKVELTYKTQAIDERMTATYHIGLKALNPADFDLENVVRSEIEPQIDQLKEKLEGIGTVNLLAVEEYESLKERYGFLSSQKQDLEKAREELLEAIRKINRTTKQLFEQTFQAVRTAFSEYFRTLFNGGHAELILVDETNPLESGIDIVAKPPGKKPQQITLLSGGEKAMTVIALLFALFRVKPSPFCVLDEIDAPLDEANVDRFLQVVKSFLPTTQFIVVTHSRKTIAASDILYGVTMEEAGVSKIVSVRLVTEETKRAQNEQEIKDSEKTLNDLLA